MTQFGGPIGPFRDRVQQRDVPVFVQGQCNYACSVPVNNPAALDGEVQARLYGAIRNVIGTKMANGQLTFRNLGEGTLGDADVEILANTGLAEMGVQVGDLAMRFAIDGGPPQREVQARIRVGGFKIEASNTGGINTGSLANQALEKAKSAFFWYVIFGAIALLIVAGVLFYIVHVVNKAAHEATPAAKAAMRWDGKSQLTCNSGREEIVLENITAKLDGAAVKASGDCKLRLVNVDITAPTGIEAGGNAIVTIEGGSITSTKHAVHALGNSKVRLSKTKVSGKVQKLGSAEVSGP